MGAHLKQIWLHGWGYTPEVFSLIEKKNIETPCLYSVAKTIRQTGINCIAKYLSAMIKEDIVLVGWSMGGLIAIEAALYCKHVKYLILIGSAPVMVNRYDWQESIDLNAFKKLQLLYNEDDKKSFNQLNALSAHGEKDAKQDAKRLSKFNVSAYNDILKEWLCELEINDQRKNLKKLSIPVLIINGEKDALIKPSALTRLKNENLQSQLLPEAGHIPFLNHAEKTMTIIHRFCASE